MTGNLSSKHSIDKRGVVVVFTHVFPNASTPLLGLFVRERMFRVAKMLPLVVVAPVPWFPFAALIRRFKPGFCPAVPYHEVQQGVDVFHPRFFYIPGMLKFLDGFFEALFAYPTLRRIERESGISLIDSHFIYPDGVAAMWLARWLGKPFCITLRGTIVRISKTRVRRKMAQRALESAAKVFSVSDSLRQIALSMGTSERKTLVVANGIDLDKFYPEDQSLARRRFGIPLQAKVMVSVGGLTERKGFHRVIELMPSLIRQHPELHLVIAGGPTREGDCSDMLRELVGRLKLEDRVHFVGAIAPDELRYAYATGDIFVLATSMEGWANVFLEAMACRLPVVSTLVGGNAEVVPHPDLGQLVEFGDAVALEAALDAALSRDWDRNAIRDYAVANSWNTRIEGLTGELSALMQGDRSLPIEGYAIKDLRS